MSRVIVLSPCGARDVLLPLSEDAETSLEESARGIIFELDAREASALRFLLRSNAEYRQLFLKAWNEYPVVEVHVGAAVQVPIHYKSCTLVASVLWEQIEIEDALHWLSTLGGAFSNLGDHSVGYAQRAGKNAFLQMRIALRTSNPSIVKQCWLFVAMSRLQQGRLATARALVQHVFHVNKNETRISLRDDKIANMCKGIWSRLRHAYSLRKANRSVR